MGELRGRRRRLSSSVGTAKAAGQKCQRKKLQKKGRVRFRAALSAAYGRCTTSVICPCDSMSPCPPA